jgi:hypothetical protein
MAQGAESHGAAMDQQAQAAELAAQPQAGADQ